jgi:hypothetical protein
MNPKMAKHHIFITNTWSRELISLLPKRDYCLENPSTKSAGLVMQMRLDRHAREGEIFLDIDLY